MELLSKISVKGVYGQIDIKELHKAGVEKKIMRVIGIVTGLKTVDTNFGTSIALMGNIKAINLETGAEFQSGKAFLPNIATNLVEGAVSNVDADSVQFAFDIGVKPVQDRQGKDSYEFTVAALVEAADNDPLKELEKKVLASLPAPSDSKK